MGRGMSGAGTTRLDGTSPISGEPFSMSCWFRRTSTTSNIVSVGDSTGSWYHSFRIEPAGELSAFTFDGSSTGATSANITVTTRWQHAFGIWAATNDRRIYLDYNDSATDATAQNAITIDRLTVGVSADSTPFAYYTGLVAEIALWKCIVPESGIGAIRAGYPPWLVCPRDFVGFWLPVGTWTDRDYTQRGNHLTATNTPTWEIDDRRLVDYRQRAQHESPSSSRRKLWNGRYPGSLIARPWANVPVAAARTPRYGFVNYQIPAIV